MTYEYQTEFTYVADTDPLTGAPVMTAIPQTVRAAKQGIPYNVLSNFGDLFKRENLREAWRLLRISTHILTKRMTAILNKIFSFKIKLYIHYNILFAIFYIYNSILYPFSSPKRSYSGANDSANYCSLAFRTPRFPIPSLQIHFS